MSISHALPTPTSYNTPSNPRQSPSPSSQQLTPQYTSSGPPHQQIISNGGHVYIPPNAASLANATANPLPPPAASASAGHVGHQTDISYLWGVVQELADVLAANRAQAAGIVSSVQMLRARSASDGVDAREADLKVVPEGEGLAVEGDTATGRAATNGQCTFSSSDRLVPTATADAAAAQAQSAHAPSIALATAQQHIHALTRERDTLLTSTGSLTSLLSDYESTLSGLMDKLRSYAYEHTTAVVATHRHYNALLEQERGTALALRCEHAQWQTGLGRVAELAREALRARADECVPGERRLRALRGENKVLRRLVGWDVESESEDEDEDGKTGDAGIGL